MAGNPRSDPPITLPAALLGRLLALAAESVGEEICGLLFGSDSAIEAATPAANIADDRTRQFELDPAALFAAHRAERAGGRRLIGHYHSHPSGTAEPSPRDLAASQGGELWLILGGGEARLWRARGDRFDECALHLI